jgi:cytochrome c-type biogenesis protein CcmH
MVILLVLGVPVAGPSLAVQPDERLADSGLESRARALSKELRCLVCQNQSIDDSDADLARDLRILLRRRLVAGDSDAQARQYLVDRYGDYVLLRPPFKTSTLVLWLGPAGFLLLGLGLCVQYYRRRAREDAPGGTVRLSEAEQRRLDTLLKDEP